MGSEWKNTVLTDAIELISGGTPKTNIPEYWGGGIPWLSVSDFNTGYRWVSTAKKTITKRGLSESATVILNTGDIIISARGTIGVIAQLARPMAFNQSCYGIRGRRGIADTDFIYYALHLTVSSMKQVAYGGVFDTITRDTFKIIELSLPPIPEQTKIAEILSTVDRAIEQTEALIAKLQRIKTGLMQDLLTKGIDKNGNIRSEKTHEFKDSILGRLPKDWDIDLTINELYMKGRIGWQGLKASEFLEEGNYLITGIHFTEDHKVDWEQCYRISDFRYNQDHSIQIKENDVIMTKDGTIGKIAYIEYLPGKASLNSHLLVLRPLKNDLLSRYLFYQLLTERFKIFVENIKTGTTRAGLSQENFGKFPLIVPKKEEQEKIASILSSIDLKIQKEQQKLNKLKKIKKGLMQDLLTGKVRVTELLKKRQAEVS